MESCTHSVFLSFRCMAGSWHRQTRQVPFPGVRNHEASFPFFGFYWSLLDAFPRLCLQILSSSTRYKESLSPRDIWAPYRLHAPSFHLVGFFQSTGSHAVCGGAYFNSCTFIRIYISQGPFTGSLLS